MDKSFDPKAVLTYCVGASQESACPGAGSPCYGGPNNGVAPNVGLYPRMHLMPSGLVITCGSTATVRSWDPATGIWNIFTQTSSYRDYGTSFMLPLNNSASERGKILIVGGDRTSTEPTLSSVEIIDFNAGSSTNPVVRSVASISQARKFLLPVILPNGKLVIFGGFDPGTGAYTNTPEMFDPVSETWTSLPEATVPRGYHGVALLLPDGRVWTAGSTPSKSVWELRTELFSPGYYFETRPTISGIPSVGDYGGTIVIPTHDAPNIDSVSLVRLGTSTHHYDTDVRILWLQILSSNSSSITVSAPLNSNLAPPGYYMVHVLNSSKVPSVAKIIQIPGSFVPDTTAPGQVVGMTIIALSDTQLKLDWTQNQEPDVNHYNVYRGTSTGFIITPGTTVGTPTSNSFSNSGLNPSTTYYYKVAAVDNVGNEGSLSTVQSGTTHADTSPPLVINTDPAYGASGVPVTKSIRATFNEQVLASSVSTSTFIVKNSAGTSIPGTVSLSQGDTVATFAPSSSLAFSTSYTATIKGGSTGVKDLAGNARTSDKVWPFTTAGGYKSTSGDKYRSSLRR